MSMVSFLLAVPQPQIPSASSRKPKHRSLRSISCFVMAGLRASQATMAASNSRASYNWNLAKLCSLMVTKFGSRSAAAQPRFRTLAQKVHGFRPADPLAENAALWLSPSLTNPCRWTDARTPGATSKGTSSPSWSQRRKNVAVAAPMPPRQEVRSQCGMAATGIQLRLLTKVSCKREKVQ